MLVHYTTRTAFFGSPEVELQENGGKLEVRGEL